MNSTSIAVGNTYVQLLDDGDAIVRMTKNEKLWEPQTRECWHALVQPETLVIDVGAYTGIYTIASALMGAHVTAFEPHPVNYQRLKDNATINSVRIQPLQCAASDFSGTADLRMKRGINFINDTASMVIGECILPVKTKRIDDMKLTVRLTLMKIDAEYHEPRIIMGAMKTIHQHRPVIVVECLTEKIRLEIAEQMAIMKYRLAAVLDIRNFLFKPG